MGVRGEEATVLHTVVGMGEVVVAALYRAVGGEEVLYKVVVVMVMAAVEKRFGEGEEMHICKLVEEEVNVVVEAARAILVEEVSYSNRELVEGVVGDLEVAVAVCVYKEDKVPEILVEVVEMGEEAMGEAVRGQAAEVMVVGVVRKQVEEATGAVEMVVEEMGEVEESRLEEEVMGVGEKEVEEMGEVVVENRQEEEVKAVGAKAEEERVVVVEAAVEVGEVNKQEEVGEENKLEVVGERLA